MPRAPRSSRALPGWRLPAQYPAGGEPPRAARAAGRDRGHGGQARVARPREAARVPGAQEPGPAEDAAEAPMIEVPARFNATTFFVDRHVAEGRGAKVAFFHDDGSTHVRGRSQELVNRTGNALRDLGVRPEQRVLLLLLDTPRVPRRVLGRDQDRRDPGPGEHDAARATTTCTSSTTAARGSRSCLGAAPRRGRAGARPGAATSARDGRRRRAAGRSSRSTTCSRRAARALEAAPHLAGRRRVLALLLGLHRPAQGRGAPAPRHGRAPPRPTRAGPRHDRGRPHVFSAAKLFFAYGLGNNDVLPAARGRPGRADTRIGPRRDAMFELIAAPPADALLRRPHALRGDARRSRRREKRYDLSCAAPLRLGGRGAARGALPTAGRSASAWRSSTASAPPRSCTSSSRTVPATCGPGSTGLAGARATRRRSSTTRAARCAPGRSATSGSSGDSIDGLLLEPAREDEGRRCSATGSQTGDKYYAGRRRLLLVLRPRRRHAQGRRHLGLAGRGGEHPDRAIPPCWRPRSWATRTPTS